MSLMSKRTECARQFGNVDSRTEKRPERGKYCNRHSYLLSVIDTLHYMVARAVNCMSLNLSFSGIHFSGSNLQKFEQMNAYRLTYAGDFCFVYSNHMLFQSSYYFNSVFRVMILCGRSIGFIVPTIQTMRAELRIPTAAIRQEIRQETGLPGQLL